MAGEISPELADAICLSVAVVVPILLIVQYRWIGFVLGVLTVWGSLYVAGLWLNALDAQRDSAFGDALWRIFGWVGGLMYCTPLFAVVEYARRQLRARRHSSRMNEK